MKRILGIAAGIVLIFLLASGIVTKAAEFFTWLLMLDNHQPTISWAGDIFVRVLTFVVTYELVGLIFSTAGFFNSDLMKVLYAIISAIISLLLSYVVWCVEQYALVILIVLAIIAVIFTIIIVVAIFVIKKIEKSEANK